MSVFSKRKTGIFHFVFEKKRYNKVNKRVCTVWGATAPQYLERARITQAQRLLEFQPDMKISRLAELVGYPLDGQYFSKVFRKLCGVTPTEYRNKC